jgi:hypothetical protein
MASSKAHYYAFRAESKLHYREELKGLHRNLKITFNITADENVRLRTRLQAMETDLQKRDKELELCIRQLQGNNVGLKTNF